MKRYVLIVLISIFFAINSFSQISDSSINVWMIEVNYSFQVPFGDMAKRFGVNSTIGAGLTYKLKSNFTFGAEVSYLWGNTMKQTEILNNLMLSNADDDDTPYGNIINSEGELSSIKLSECGFYAGAKFGYVIKFKKPNPNSGIILNVGGGILQHKILIENKNNNIPSLSGDYKKGYDRLSNGFALREFLGYQFLSSNRFINFYVGVEFIQAFTKCRRLVNFDTMQKDISKRHDFLLGIRAGWILPIYNRAPDKYYFSFNSCSLSD